MKRVITSAVIFLCSIATSFAQFSGSGSGTENDPYLILNPIQLNQMRNFLNQKDVYFKLMADIDLTEFLEDENPSQGWQPVGSSSAAFKGIVDGNGKTVSGLWIGRIVGLDWGSIGAMGSTVENKSYNRTVVIDQGVAQDVEDDENNGSGVSATTLKLKATYVAMGWDFTDTWAIQETECFPYMQTQTAPPVITSQVVSGATTISGKCVDGGTVTLDIDGVKQHIVSTGNTFSFTVSPLLAGHEARISAKAEGKEQSYNGIMTATGKESYVGGLVGMNVGTISNCYSMAKVTSSYNAAGLIAYNYGVVENSYATGDLYSQNYAAGVIGYNDGENALIRNCAAMNNKIEVVYESQQVQQGGGYGQRIIGGIKNGAPAPRMNNFALNSMQVSVNNVPQKVYDDIMNGTAKTESELKASATYQGLGWDFGSTWQIDENEGYPYLQNTPVDNGNSTPGEGSNGEEWDEEILNKKVDLNGDNKLDISDVLLLIKLISENQ